MIERLLAAERLITEGSPDSLATAERLLRSIADADPRSAIAVAGLARVAVARGDEAAARDLAERALIIDPEEHAARRLLESLAAAAAAAAAAPEPAPEPEATERAPRPRSWLRRILDRLLGRPGPVS